jgi:hypothetical protein
MAQFYQIVFDHKGDIRHGPHVFDFKEIFGPAADEIQAAWRMIDRNKTEQIGTLYDSPQIIVKRVNPYPSSAMFFFYASEETPETTLATTLLIGGRSKKRDDVMLDFVLTKMREAAREAGSDVEVGNAFVRLKYRPLTATIFWPYAMTEDARCDVERIIETSLPLAAAFFRMRGVI